LISFYRYQNFKFPGFLGPLLSKEQAEQAELDQVIAIGCIVALCTQKWMNLASLKY